MHKDELIQMHTLLFQIKNYLEQNGAPNEHFDEYKKIGVSPIHVHRSKHEHKKAIFILGKELAGLMSPSEFSNQGRVSGRLAQYVRVMERQNIGRAL